MDGNTKNLEDDAGDCAFVVGVRTSMPSDKATRPFDILWEWNSPGETS